MLHYLILAHKNPKQLEFLIERLQFPDNKIYIQLDKKSNIEEYIHLKQKVVFIKKRISINRGGFSIVQATINAYKEIILEMGPNDHIILMSGQDLPLKSQKYIQDFLKKHINKSFINYYSNRENIFNNKKRIIGYYFNDFIVPLWIENILKTIAIFAGQKKRVEKRRPKIFSGILSKIFKILPPKKYIIKNYTLYGGSQRQVIAYKHLKYMLNFLETSKGIKFMNAFRYTNCSDERFFQILLLNSPHKEEIKNKLLRYMHRIEGNRSPDTLETKDIQILKESKKLFARKFDIEFNIEIMKKIDMLCNYESQKPLAIGKGASNVKLASQITGYQIEIK